MSLYKWKALQLLRAERFHVLIPQFVVSASDRRKNTRLLCSMTKFVR